jgi:hypothetical protein
MELGNKMKITKRQLKRLIKEMLVEDTAGPPISGEQAISLGGSYGGVDTSDPHGDEAEYNRGYQDGFDEVPPAQDATADYDVGYEDGAHDASMDDDKDEERWFKS